MRTLDNRSLAGVICATSIVCLTLGAAAIAAADIGGKWRIDEGNGMTVFIDITQAGNNVSLVFDGVALSGQLGDSLLHVFNFESANGGQLDAVVSPDETMMRGSALLRSTFPSTTDFAGQRCGCFDGNSDDGDGCNALCQVEECFTCETPSSCTPSPERAPCDDGNACTAGEVCAEGACGNGVQLNPCINLTGIWRWDTHLANPVELRQEAVYRLVQTGTFLEVFSPPELGPSWAGSIDTSTGDVTLHAVVSSPECSIMSNNSVRAQATTDGMTMTGSRSFVGGPAPSCAVFEEALKGVRCDVGGEPCLRCPGDCDRDSVVTVDELVRSIRVVLGQQDFSACKQSDLNADGVITVNEVVSGVRSLLVGCPGS